MFSNDGPPLLVLVLPLLLVLVKVVALGTAVKCPPAASRCCCCAKARAKIAAFAPTPPRGPNPLASRLPAPPRDARPPPVDALPLLPLPLPVTADANNAEESAAAEVDVEAVEAKGAARVPLGGAETAGGTTPSRNELGTLVLGPMGDTLPSPSLALPGCMDPPPGRERDDGPLAPLAPPTPLAHRLPSRTTPIRSDCTLPAPAKPPGLPNPHAECGGASGEAVPVLALPPTPPLTRAPPPPPPTPAPHPPGDSGDDDDGPRGVVTLGWLSPLPGVLKRRVRGNGEVDSRWATPWAWVWGGGVASAVRGEGPTERCDLSVTSRAPG